MPSESDAQNKRIERRIIQLSSARTFRKDFLEEVVALPGHKYLMLGKVSWVREGVEIGRQKEQH